MIWPDQFKRKIKTSIDLKINSDIELHLLKQQHAGELFTLTEQNREHLQEWLPWVDTNKTIEDTRKFIKRCVEQSANGTDFVLGIWYKGNLAGAVGLHKVDWSNRSGNIGYWLGASFQGHGIMTKSCRALVEYAFNGLRLNRVQIRCVPGNKKSRAIPERLGFKQEGISRQAMWLHDHFVDLIIYGMLATEWQNET